MVQFNLLPDVKLEYMRAVRRRRLVSTVCIIVAGSFLAIFILMLLFVRVNQHAHMKHLDKDITENVNKLRSNTDLDKILTVQNQLSSLPGLHEQKVMGSRVFDYLAQLTPGNTSVTNVQVDFVNKSITIKGSADSLATINKFVDTIKYTEYVNEDQSGESADTDSAKAFSAVVLKSFALSGQTGSTQTAQSVSFEIGMNYEDVIFSNTAKEGNPLANTIRLKVPNQISNQSETQKPNLDNNGGGN